MLLLTGYLLCISVLLTVSVSSCIYSLEPANMITSFMLFLIFMLSYCVTANSLSTLQKCLPFCIVLQNFKLFIQCLLVEGNVSVHKPHIFFYCAFMCEVYHLKSMAALKCQNCMTSCTSF
jgi:hypothetical protein